MTAAVPSCGPMLWPRNKSGVALSICMSSSWYRLLQFETHKSTSTPSRHRVSLLASGDASADACRSDRAAVTVNACFASAVWAEIRPAQNASLCRLCSLSVAVGCFSGGTAAAWGKGTVVLCLLVFPSDLAVDPPVTTCAFLSHWHTWTLNVISS